MSKIICDICGTVYPDTAAACPICGFPQKESTGAVESGSLPVSGAGAAAAAAASKTKGGRFSNKNVKKRNQGEAEVEKRPRREKPEKPEKPPKPEKEPKPEKAPKPVKESQPKKEKPVKEPQPKKEKPVKEPKPEGEKSNRGLVIIAIVLTIGVLLVGGYIISRFIGGRDAYDNPSAPVIGTNPSAETTLPTETTLPVETGVPCAGLTISDASVEFLGANRSWKLAVSTNPADTTDELTFASSDENVVLVTPDGRLTSVGPGTATITITCGDVVKQCQVVCDFEAETEPVETTGPEETTAPTEPEETTKPTEPDEDDKGLKLTHEDVSLFYEGESFTISAKWDGEWLGNGQVSWVSNDPEVAQVENGKVTAVGSGYTTIVATYNGKTAKCIIRCRFDEDTEETTAPTEDSSSASWSISHTDVSINVGEAFSLRITDENGNVANVTWSASTPGIVNVSGNTVTGAATGMTTLTATVDGQSFSCIVRVR